jgi:midasin
MCGTGRKVLSRALRSRFLQIMIPDLPCTELITVLEQRCAMPASHASKLVAVMSELRILRSRGNVFAGCHGLITPRDLFRWASRQASSYDELAMHGYSLLAERLRSQDEREQVLQVCNLQDNGMTMYCQTFAHMCSYQPDLAASIPNLVWNT